MRGVALSDLHLGFRNYSAKDRGRNQRELDVEQAWFYCVQKITEIMPDIVTIAGDIFHHPRVSDFAKKAFMGGLSDIARDCRCPIVVLQGNHDAGRTADVLTPVHLPAGLIPGLHVVTKPCRLMLNDQSVAVSCFPFVALEDVGSYKVQPDPKADVNILLMHAAVKSEGGKLPYFYSGDQAIDVAREADDWDVIALGDFHEFTRLHDDGLVFYSGAIERTSSNIWQEDAPKGFVEWDTDSVELTLHEIPTRRMEDHECDGQKGGALIVNESLHAMLEVMSMDDALVRLKVEDFPREEREHIDWGAVRRLKNRCTHFYLDIRYAKPEAVDLGDRRDSDRHTLAEEAVAFFSDDEEAVRELAFRFLEIQPEVEEVGA